MPAIRCNRCHCRLHPGDPGPHCSECARDPHAGRMHRDGMGYRDRGPDPDADDGANEVDDLFRAMEEGGD